MVDGKQVYEMHTTKNTVKDALDELGLSLNEGDEVVLYNFPPALKMA